MSFLDKFCCICLCNGAFVNELKHMFDVDNDGVSHFNKLTSSVAEMDFQGMNDQLCICGECCVTLNTVYNFRLMCLSNKTNLITYISQLQERNNDSDNKDIKTEINKEETKIKCEYEDNSYNFENNTSASKNSQDQISSVTIKKEYESEEGYNYQCKIETEDHVNERVHADIKMENVEHEMAVEDEHVGNFPKVYIQNQLENSSEGENETETDIGLATLSSLPEKSRGRYLITYGRFNTWCKEKNLNRITEKVLLAYFAEKSEVIKSSTMWSEYSMLKATLVAMNSIDISKMDKLVAFLKRQAVGYKSKKAEVFYRDEIVKFLEEAPDDTYLMMKVVLILGIAGGCRREEIKNITIDDIEDVGSTLIVTIPDSKTKTRRKFTVTTGTGPDLLQIYRTYAAMRPAELTHRRFFLSFRYGRCFPQALGLNNIGKVPQQIATYLGLPNPTLYTGHSFRRSTTFLVNARVDITTFGNSGTDEADKIMIPIKPKGSKACNK